MVDNSFSSSQEAARPKPVVLVLLAGWGIAPASSANVISQAKTPFFNSLVSEFPAGVLKKNFKNRSLSYLSLGGGRPYFSDAADYSESSNLSKTISQAGLKQLKIAETENFALATHFFNGRKDADLPQEKQQIISSYSGSYADCPELVLKDLGLAARKALKSGQYDFILLDIASLDLQARRGTLESLEKTISLVDKTLAKIFKLIESLGAVAVLCGVYGNAEQMKDASSLSNHDITENPVPIIIFGAEYKGKNLGQGDALNNDLSLMEPLGTLADIAPTIIKIMKILPPEDMSGKSLV